MTVHQLFTSVSASIQYIIIGNVMWDYGVALFIIGVLASFAGQTLLNWIVATYKRKSYIVSSNFIEGKKKEKKKGEGRK